MVVLSVEHAEPRIEGYLCRHMYKVRPGVYAGRLSASRREAVWKHIIKEQEDIDAVMCYDGQHNAVCFESNGMPTRSVSMVDGIPMLSFNIEAVPAWYKYLAKPASGGHPGKSLREHMLEAGVFARTLLTESAMRSTLRTITSTTDISDEEMLDNICLIVSLHDLGKIHPVFQNKMDVETEVFFDDEGSVFRHEKYSRKLAVPYLKEKGAERRTRRVIGDIIADHHQNKPDNNDKAYLFDGYEDIEKQAEEMMDYFCTVFPFTPFKITNNENLFGQLVSGVLRCSDWAVSSFANELSARQFESEDAYRSTVKERCLKYIKDGGLAPTVPKTYYSYGDLFNFLNMPSAVLHPLQTVIRQAVLEHNRFLLTVIEDQPGAGKTEAALYAVFNILKSMGRQGLYFALPTMATAEAMYSRLQEVKNRTGLFSDTDLKLFTGLAWMSDGTEEDVEDRLSWTKSGPRKLFSKFACGTIDQIMAAAAKIKAGDLRLLGLSNKVVIIDEFHEYDTFMLDIIKKLLKWLKAMGVPVIILSATLRNKTLSEICSIYSGEQPAKTGYPLITMAEEGHVFQYEPAPSTLKRYDVEIIKENDAIAKAIATARAGGNVLYIANTVNHVINVCKKLKQNGFSEDKITLYTARTTPANKETVGERLVYLYGLKGKRDGCRPSGTIVVATQVMEVSVDVDFDTVFSELAPTDSLIQRMGREKRHDDKGTVRENGFKSVFYVVLPDKSDSFWFRPYVRSVLESTEKLMNGYSSVKIPEDIRTIIERTYAVAGDDWRREALAAGYAKGSEVGEPDDYYAIDSNLKSCVETRKSDYKTIDILCLADEDIEILKAHQIDVKNKEWSKDAIRNHSVKVPEYMLKNLDVVFISADCLPRYISDYFVVRDKPSYWGKNGIFLGGNE